MIKRLLSYYRKHRLYKATVEGINMNADAYLKRYPKARGSTVAYLALRDAKTEQLRKELAEPRAKYTRAEANRFMNGWLSRVMGMLMGGDNATR